MQLPVSGNSWLQLPWREPQRGFTAIRWAAPVGFSLPLLSGGSDPMHRRVCYQWTHDLLVLPKGLFMVNPNQPDPWNWLEISSEQALQRDFWHFCFQHWLHIQQKETPASLELFCQIWSCMINSQKIIVACPFSAFCFYPAVNRGVFFLGLFVFQNYLSSSFCKQFQVPQQR